MLPAQLLQKACGAPFFVDDLLRRFLDLMGQNASLAALAIGLLIPAKGEDARARSNHHQSYRQGLERA
jgi:hypothetical protein